MAELRAGVLVHAQHIGHAEEAGIAFHRGGLVHADKGATLVYETGQLLQDFSVLPDIAAAPGASGKARIYNYVHVVQRAVLHILEADKAHVHRQAGKSLVDVDQVVHVSLMEMAGQGPGAQLSPVVQNRYLRADRIGRALAVEAKDGAEFVGDLLDVIAEIREILHQMQVSAQADSLHRLAQQRAAHAVPVFLRFQRGITALHEGRRSAQSHGEQIRMQAQLVGIHLHAGAQPRLVAGEHALDQAVKAEFLESSVVGLDPHPAVVIEHIGFFPVGMHHVNQLLPKGDDKIVDERHPVRFPLISGHVGHVQLSLIDEILGRHAVAVFLFKLVQSPLAHGKVVGTPVRKQVAAAFVASPDPDKIVEHGGEAHHRGRRMGLAPVFHPAEQIFPGFRIHGIDLHQMLLVPVVGGVVVHGNLFPDPVGHEADRIGMEGHGGSDGDASAFRVVAPAFRGQKLIRGAVIHLPVGSGVFAVVHPELLFKKAVHQTDGKRAVGRRLRSRHQEALLQLVLIFLRPFIVVADDADGGIDSIARIQDLVGKDGSIAVTDYVRPPFLCHFQGQLFISGFSRQGKTTFFLFFTHINLSPCRQRAASAIYNAPSFAISSDTSSLEKNASASPWPQPWIQSLLMLR